MEQPVMAFSAVFLKVMYGYVGFIEEMPEFNAHGATLDEARQRLHELATVVFDAERQKTRELLAGKDAVREPFVVAVSIGAPSRC